ncbi:MAG: hypothetical protein SGBAC_001057 [Bacillariaceae sp.]
MSPEKLSKTCASLQDVIGTDAGNRGMKCLIVPGDLENAAIAVASLPPKSTVVVLSGFPCCVTHDPPTETDGPPGTFAIARAMAALSHEVIVVTDTCNEAVFAAALENLALPSENCGSIVLQAYPPSLSEEEEKKFAKLALDCSLLVACERAGPSRDGVCYTMRAIDMNEKGLIAPLHRLIKESEVPFIGIGDGGNELGMGKVIDQIMENIPRGETIGCVFPADYLVAASVSNWGGYALAAAAAAAKADDKESLEAWLQRCLPSEDEEIALLNRCVAVGCRDGVSGKVEATVDGMPLETSMQCLRDIRKAALDAGS